MPRAPTFLSALLSAATKKATTETERDELTGAYTRRSAIAAIESERAALGAGAAKLGLVLLDLDRFKEINDLHGHMIGDHVLHEVANRFSAVLGSSDLLARLGGDEFLVFARGVSTFEQLEELKRRLNRAVSNEPIVLDAVQVNISVTAGAALVSATDDIEQALRIADQRMYLAKRKTGTDAFDRVSEMIVGLLEAGDQGIDASLASAVAEVALATRTYVATGETERWWPDGERPEAQSVRQLAAKARELDQVVEEGSWRLAVPLRGDGAPIGAFVVEREFPFTKADQIALSRAGLALGQAMLRLNESVAARRRISELEHLAFRDENTGLANRRALLGELSRLDSIGGPLALLFVDFDGLRAVNNQLSYEHGNELLRVVAAEIERGLNRDEFAARLHGSGGDEFIVVCPKLDVSKAAARAADLEERLSPENLELPDSLSPLYAGGSVGYAIREDGEEPLALVERAATLMRTRKATRKSALPRR